jgi:hypothetical protein
LPPEAARAETAIATWARNERRAKAFAVAEALAAIEDYLEMPYRVRRRPASEPGG